MDKEIWIKENVYKFSLELVREFMAQYAIDNEDDTRQGLAEYYYHNMFG